MLLLFVVDADTDDAKVYRLLNMLLLLLVVDAHTDDAMVYRLLNMVLLLFVADADTVDAKVYTQYVVAVVCCRCRYRACQGVYLICCYCCLLSMPIPLMPRCILNMLLLLFVVDADTDTVDAKVYT